MAKKIKVYVEPNETVSECLDRINEMGYRPIRRIEKPVFEQTGAKDVPVHSHQSILFECVSKES
ncbi:MAG: NETI motif-containing protein [Exiguobacterium marinum]|uniref:NETI motif-containing protein n=1 Tax=Exiguobacterium marinum TaxID=273528 RepID=A0ABY7X2I8_9BACL|nr:MULTISPECIES: NETI motif-containing protein [Exiguobacterium]WDH76334.1 NETI motif-containing protein [Exiguobacterium marinum]